MGGSDFYVYHSRILDAISKIDGCIQKVVLVSLKKGILHLQRYPPVAVHSIKRRIWYKMRMEFISALMEDDVSWTINSCATRAGDRERAKTKPQMKFFPAYEPQNVSRWKFLPTLTNEKRRYILIILKTERCSKMTRSVSSRRTTAACDENVFQDYWIVLYNMPNILLTYKGPQYLSNFFATICGLLEPKHLTTGALHR